MRRPRKPNQSKVFGTMPFGPVAVRAYEALVPIECAFCDDGTTIQPGNLFTRQQMMGGGPRTFPSCVPAETQEKWRSLARNTGDAPGEEG